MSKRSRWVAEMGHLVLIISAFARMDIARIAIGEEAVQDLAFYASIYQKALQAQYGKERPDSFAEETQEEECAGDEANFDDTAWGLIRSGARDSDDESEERKENKHLELCAWKDKCHKILKQ